MIIETVSFLGTLVVIAGAYAGWLYRAKKAEARKAAAWSKCANCSHFKFEHHRISNTIDRCQGCGCTKTSKQNRLD